MSSNLYREHYSSEGQTQISARIDDDLKADIEQLADDRDISQTELIAQSLAETVADANMIDAGSEIEPDDPTARELYRAMVDRMDPGEEVGLTPIKNILSQDTQIPADQIPMWIQRLNKRGYATIRSSAPGKSVTRYAVAVKPPTAELREWSPFSDDREPNPDEVTNAEETIDDITDDAEPITDEEDDPAADAGIESDDDHVLNLDTVVETDPNPDETDDGEIVSDGGIRLVDYYRGIYQLRNGQPVPIDEIDLYDSKLKEIADQGWIEIHNQIIYCRVVPEDQIRVDDRNFATLGEKKREHFARAGTSYDSYLKNRKNLTPDPTRLVIDRTADDDKLDAINAAEPIRSDGGETTNTSDDNGGIGK